MNDTTLSALLDPLRPWIGRTEQRTDLVTAAMAAGLSATLDRTEPEPVLGADMPDLIHWLCFRPTAPQHELGPDGHPLRGGFLPPVPLPRRMWAGGRIEFNHPLRAGDEVVRQSRILNVDAKQGRSGPLVFVTVRHEISNAQGLAISEEQDLVYREAATAQTPPTSATHAPADAAFARTLRPDTTLLFRYSALTFNSHRIHYDRPYATKVEGYPGLVVHGPLIATLLVDLLRRQHPGARLRRYRYTALRPTFDLHPLRLCGREDGPHSHALWSQDHEGVLTMTAQAQIA